MKPLAHKSPWDRAMRLVVSLPLMSFLSVALLGWSVSAQQKQNDPLKSKWEVLENCQLVTNAPIDGDSFHIVHQEREYIVRLYFVDTPETDASLRDRIQDQAAYFGLSTNDIPRAGKLAEQFTRAHLTAKKFTVATRWQNAMGRSTLARFYGIVLVDGKNLAEELVANGLARIYGLRANWPDGPRSVTFINTLKNKELSARGEKRGVWDENAFPRTKESSVLVAETTNTVANASVPAKPLIDLNTASAQELEALPGIGKVMAERIIAHRPYKQIEDFDKVPGIGAKTIERLRPLIRVEPDKP